MELIVRENGGATFIHNGSLGRGGGAAASTSASAAAEAAEVPSASRPIEKPQQNFPTSYVHSTHRQEWFDKLDSKSDDDQPTEEAETNRTRVEPIQDQEDEQEEEDRRVASSAPVEVPQVVETPIEPMEEEEETSEPMDMNDDHEDPGPSNLSTSLPSHSELPESPRLRPDFVQDIVSLVMFSNVSQSWPFVWILILEIDLSAI